MTQRTGKVTTPTTEEDEAPREPDPDHAWKTLSLVNDWVKHAEAKGTASLAAAGVAAGVLYNLVKDQTKPSIWLSIVAVLSGLLLVLCGLAALATIVPRIRLPETGWVARLYKKRPLANPAVQEADAAEAAADQDPANLLFFSHIARDYPRDAPTYAQILAALTTNNVELTEHIARQVHANALIAHRKFTFSNRAVQLLGGGLAFLAITAAIVGHH